MVPVICVVAEVSSIIIGVFGPETKVQTPVERSGCVAAISITSYSTNVWSGPAFTFKALGVSNTLISTVSDDVSQLSSIVQVNS